MFDDIEIEKSKFHDHKNPILVDVDICKMLTSREVSCKKILKILY